MDWTENLFTFTLDAAVEPFRAGQFFRLGLVEGETWVSRAYSAASAPGQPLEFYVALVEGGALTPDLHRKAKGDEIAVFPRATGHFTLEHVHDAELLWLVCTGTGLAPYISMLRSEEPWARFGRVIVVHGVRHAADLCYREELLALGQRRGDRLSWVPVVSREPTREDVICGRIPQQLEAVEARAGYGIRPETSQVLLCGNPDMVVEVEALLAARGLRRNKLKLPGHITTERYW